jgi:hypothetical protein
VRPTISNPSRSPVTHADIGNRHPHTLSRPSDEKKCN